MNLLSLLDDLRVIAQNGLVYDDDPHDAYDKERYERILELVSEHYGKMLDIPPTDARERLAGELGHTTAKVGAGAAIFDENGRVLLMEHVGDKGWGLPGGFIEPNESARDAAVRETREETGLDVQPVELVGVYSFTPEDYPVPHSYISVIYQCTVSGGALQLSHEGEALQYRAIDDVPKWYPDTPKTRKYVADAHETWLNADDN